MSEWCSLLVRCNVRVVEVRIQFFGVQFSGTEADNM